MLEAMRAFWVCAAAALAIAACRDNPNIDGSKVAASGTSCPEVCNRLIALCGYAPPDCSDAVDGGYCENNFDDTINACMSTASSCQAAWDCPNAEPVDLDAGDESTTDDSSTDDSSTGDAAAE